MNPRRNEPIVLSALMLANLAVFMLSSLQELATGVPTMIIDWGLIPERLTESLLTGSLGEIGYNLLTLFTCTFLHGGVDHFFNNLILLIIFGLVVERDLGSRRFAVVYLVSGLVGSLSHYVFHSFSPYPMIGASGAISGVLGAFLVSVLASGQRISILRLIGVAFVVQWVIEQAASVLVTAGARSGIAHGAHLGGFFCGLILTIVIVRAIRQARAQETVVPKPWEVEAPPAAPPEQVNDQPRAVEPELPSDLSGGQPEEKEDRLID